MFGQFVEKRESMQTNNKMAVAPVGKLIWQMSIPPLISMFLQYSYNLIDSAFVARLSENALTAVSLSFPITTLMNATSIWIGVGVNVLIAGYLGQGKQNEANTTVTHGLLLAFGIGALLNLLSLLIMKPYFRAFTNNEEIYNYLVKFIQSREESGRKYYGYRITGGIEENETADNGTVIYKFWFMKLDEDTDNGMHIPIGIGIGIGGGHHHGPWVGIGW